MTSVVWNFISISAPFVIGLLAIVAAILAPDAKIKLVLRQIIKLCRYFKIPVFLPIESQTPLIVRAIVILIAVASFSFPAFRDYSGFFPDRFTIQVYFDEDGIKTTLANIGDPRSLNLENQWEQKRQEYFSRINQKLADEHIPFKFMLSRGATIGEGRGVFKAKMNDKWGLQRYIITEANGRVEFVTKSSGSDPSQTVRTIYKLSKVNTYVEPSIADIYIHHATLIKPEFSQMIELSPAAPLRPDHELTAATRAQLWPYVDIGQTVYLVRDDAGGYIPIGYAIYTPE